MSAAWEVVIGLEIHTQLATRSKIFSAASTAYGAPPNTQACLVDLGYPGVLPVLNEEVVRMACKFGLAVNATVARRSVFARKNYFYPDLPKGYQISQFDKPIGEGGVINFALEDGTRKSCRLTRIHIEEDAGKSLHPEKGEGFTRVDLNRCGTPLIEIVSEPEMRSPEEAYAYFVKVKQILQYTKVSSGDMEKGHLRCDANISVRPVGQEEFGTRTEIKNMNSFKGVERAIKFEIQRQVKLLKSGGSVTQATLLWDESRQVAETMRSKEESHDYRYFPEPDLVNLVVKDDWIENVKENMPELPDEKSERFVKDYQIRPYDAMVLTDTVPLADYYDEVMQSAKDGRIAANWVQSELLGVLKDSGDDISTFKVRPNMIADIVNKIESKEISGKMAKTVFAEMVETGKGADAIIKEKGLVQISDEKQLLAIIDSIISANSGNVDKYKSGKTNLLGFFVGQVMKETKGQANPEVVNRLLKQKLDG